MALSLHLHLHLHVVVGAPATWSFRGYIDPARRRRDRIREQGSVGKAWLRASLASRFLVRAHATCLAARASVTAGMDREKLEPVAKEPTTVASIARKKLRNRATEPHAVTRD
jgi:hypothetical protein